MGKRLKVGDVFEVFLSSGHVSYFQYIGDDATALYSQVICVFKKKYGSANLPEISHIVSDEVDFYTHLHSIKSGLEEGLWQLVGNYKIIKTELPFFRNANDLQTKKIVERWHIWRMNEPWKNVVKNYKLLKKSYPGSTLLKNESLVQRIELGKYPYHYPKYPGED